LRNPHLPRRAVAREDIIDVLEIAGFSADRQRREDLQEWLGFVANGASRSW
jgi:hypothetical protein